MREQEQRRTAGNGGHGRAWFAAAVGGLALAAVAWRFGWFQHGSEGDRGSWVNRMLVSDRTVAVPAGLRPVRWNNREHPEIGSIAGIDRLWNTYDLSQGDPLGMTCDDDGASELFVRTAAEWAKARTQGCYSYSTVAMMFEAPFLHHAALWCFLEEAQPAARSGFDSLDLRALAPLFLPPSVDRWRIERTGGDEWTLDDGTLRRMDESTFGWIVPLAVGDYDGDGSEDLFAAAGGGFTQGTGRNYDTLLYTWRPSGRLIETSARLGIGWMRGGDGIAEARARWAANCGLPEGRRFRLRGRCECGEWIEKSDERIHWLEVELVARGGFLEGAYRCKNQPKSVPLEGTFGRDDAGVLQEFGIDGAATAKIGFTYKYEGGMLTIEGWRCGSGQLETDDFVAVGSVEDAADGAENAGPRTR